MIKQRESDVYLSSFGTIRILFSFSNALLFALHPSNPLRQCLCNSATFFLPPATHSFSALGSVLSCPSSRVRKSKNFPDSKIFGAKTFRIKRVNRVDFQICDKCAKKVFLQDFVHKRGPNMLSTSYRHSSRSSKLSLYHPDIFLN